MHDNLLTTIPAASFQQVPNLAELSIGGNNFRTIGTDSFSNFTSLASLDLSDADLSEGLNPDAFSNLKGLRKLKLNGCSLTYIPTDTLQNLPRLDELYLNRNMFTEIPAHALKGNKRLRKLEISGCPSLERVSSEAFNNNLDLQNITMSKNRKLTYLLPETFFMPHIIHLDLHGNDLQQVSKQLARWNDIQFWYIHDNPLHCNCSSAWLWKSLTDSNGTSGPDVLCFAPPGLRDRSLASLQHHDLSCGMDANTKAIFIGCVVFLVLIILSVILILFICRHSNQSGSCINHLLKGHKLGGGNGRDNGTYPRDPYPGYIMAKPVPVTEL